MNRKSPFIESIRRTMRLRGYAIKTEKSYLHWIRYYIRFHRMKHPAEMGRDEVVAFLDHLASERNVSSSTQSIALNAIAFLYNKILDQPLKNLNFRLATKARRLPTVLTPKEACLIIDELDDIHRLIVQMMYGSGLRVLEALGLRVQDISFDNNSVKVRNGKGGKERVTLLSQKLKPELETQIANALAVQQEDNSNGVGPSLPDALGRKYPTAFRSAGWMFLFPSISLCHHPVNNKLCRHHLHHTVIRKALKRATTKLKFQKRVTCHTFRHSFMKHIHMLHPSGHPADVQIGSLPICATHLLESGTDIRTVQKLLGHNDVKTTQIVSPGLLPHVTLARPCASYTHVIGQHYAGTSSPLDRISEERPSYTV